MLESTAGHTVHRYRRGAYVVGVVLQDAVLLAVASGALLLHAFGAVGTILAVASVTVVAWGVLTLHFPSQIDITERGVTFRRYGLSHDYAWKDVQAVRLRRFLVKDRVLVRLLPAAPWRGRYWITDSIEGYDVLVRALELRARNPANSSGPS